MEKSIDRAIALLKTPIERDDYVSIKLLPPSGCCCTDCWPITWNKINQFIAPSGPVKHEGDALIESNGNRFVLESHEHGPEIVVCLSLIKDLAPLVKPIVDLICVFLGGLSKETKKQPPRIKILKRQIIKGEIEEETSIEIELPISKRIEKQLEEKIYNLINQKPWR